MATKFHLPDGTTTDIVALTLPVFFVRSPEDFLEFVRAQKPDPETGKPDLDRIGRFVDAHPESQAAIGFSMFSQPPACYSSCKFFGIHAFRWVDSDGATRYVRYRWEPTAGEAFITEDESRALGKDYLRTEIATRLARGPVEFRLLLQVAAPEDDPSDPTQAWPEDRELVYAGELRITEIIDDRTACEELVWDPTRVTDGIECSDDRILHARPGAYSVSHARRSSRA